MKNIQQRCHKTVGIIVFLDFVLLVDGRIPIRTNKLRIRVRTNKLRIQKAKKHTEPTNADPEH